MTLIELSPTQVDHVVRAAHGSANMSMLLSGLSDIADLLEDATTQIADRRFSKSLLLGLLVLATFPTDGSYVANSDLARVLGMTASSAHRYVTTLTAAGLLERDPATRRYRLVGTATDGRDKRRAR
jgi:DNA-binding MarR family transcriptional regulator